MQPKWELSARSPHMDPELCQLWSQFRGSVPSLPSAPVCCSGTVLVRRNEMTTHVRARAHTITHTADAEPPPPGPRRGRAWGVMHVAWELQKAGSQGCCALTVSSGCGSGDKARHLPPACLSDPVSSTHRVFLNKHPPYTSWGFLYLLSAFKIQSSSPLSICAPSQHSARFVSETLTH